MGRLAKGLVWKGLKRIWMIQPIGRTLGLDTHINSTLHSRLDTIGMGNTLFKIHSIITYRSFFLSPNSHVIGISNVIKNRPIPSSQRIIDIKHLVVKNGRHLIQITFETL